MTTYIHIWLTHEAITFYVPEAMDALYPEVKTPELISPGETAILAGFKSRCTDIYKFHRAMDIMVSTPHEPQNNSTTC